MKLFFTLKDLVKYGIFIFIVYTILKIVPSQQIFSKDLFLIICIVLGSFVLVDHLYKNKYFLNMIEGYKNSNKSNKKVKVESFVETPKKASTPAVKKASAPAVKKASAPTVKKAPAPTVKKASAPTVKKASAPTVKKASKPTPKKASKPTPKKASKPTPKKASKPTVKNASKPTVKNASTPTPTPTKKVLPTPAKKNSGGSSSKKSDNAPVSKKGNDLPAPKADIKKGKTEIKNETHDIIDPSRTKISVSEVQKQLDDLKQQLIHLQTPVIETQKNRMNSLINELQKSNILNENEISNIYSKLDTKIFTIEDVITNLEKIKETTINNTQIKSSRSESESTRPDDFSFYNPNLPADFYKPLGGDKELTMWSTDYTILNTDKWKVPMPKPPVCINNSPCKVCPGDDGSTAVDYPATLKDWDVARKVTNIDLNKDWMYKKTKA